MSLLPYNRAERLRRTLEDLLPQTWEGTHGTKVNSITGNYLLFSTTEVGPGVAPIPSEMRADLQKPPSGGRAQNRSCRRKKDRRGKLASRGMVKRLSLTAGRGPGLGRMGGSPWLGGAYCASAAPRTNNDVEGRN